MKFNNKKNKKVLVTLSFFLFFFLFFLFIHWPYLWTLSINEFLNFFESFKVGSNPDVYFNGIFYNSKYLPTSYIPVWILISTPEIIILSFLVGFIFLIRRIFKRFISIKENSFFDDLWRGNNEKIDFFLFLSFIQIVIVYLSFNLSLYSGWRHFLFLHYFIIYFSIYGIYFLLIKMKKYLIFRKYFIIFLYICVLEISFNLFKYHPYQSVYYNNLVSKEMKTKFEIDTQSLSRSMALQDILNDIDQYKNVQIGTASWTP